MSDKKHKEKEHEKYEVMKYSEGPVARWIERRTAKLPSDLFLWAAVGSIATSWAFKLKGSHDKAHWVGQWVAPFLLFGLYNKIVKVAGSDRLSARGI